METTTRNASLQDLAVLLQDQHARRHDVVVPARSIKAQGGQLVIEESGDLVPDPDKGLIEGPGIFTPTKVCDEGIAEKLSIPTAYLRKLRENRPDLYDANVNGWLHGFTPDAGHPDARVLGADQRKFLIRCFKGDDGGSGVARAFLSDSFKVIDNFDVLVAALAGIKAAGIETQVVSCDLTDRRMYVKIVAPAIQALAPALLEGYRNPLEGNPHWGFGAAAREHQGYEPGKEPVVFGGFILSNSETGGGAFTLTPRLLVQICQNGLVIGEDALRAVHLGGKLEEGVIQWSDETREKQVELITAKAKDAVATFLDVEYVKKAVLKIEAKAGKPVEDPAATVENVTKALSFPKDFAAGILDHFIKGGQVTAGGVVNAITSFAQTISDADVAFDLEAQAVRALELAAA